MTARMCGQCTLASTISECMVLTVRWSYKRRSVLLCSPQDIASQITSPQMWRDRDLQKTQRENWDPTRCPAANKVRVAVFVAPGLRESPENFPRTFIDDKMLWQSRAKQMGQFQQGWIPSPQAVLNAQEFTWISTSRWQFPQKYHNQQQ